MPERVIIEQLVARIHRPKRLSFKKTFLYSL